MFSTTLIAAGPEELDDATAFRWLFGMSLITKPTLPMLDGLTVRKLVAFLVFS